MTALTRSTNLPGWHSEKVISYCPCTSDICLCPILITYFEEPREPTDSGFHSISQPEQTVRQEEIRFYTRLVTGIRNLPYMERMQRLGLHSLQRRRIGAHQITAFKIFMTYAAISYIFYDILLLDRRNKCPTVFHHRRIDHSNTKRHSQRNCPKQL